jgi:solute carrier family 25 phosphate transporter 23/24/25/41
MDKQSASVADARVDELWTTLDMRKQGYLDIAGLRKGLRKLDHRMCRHPTRVTWAKGAPQL